MEIEKSIQTIVDFVTGETVPDIGAEANRQAIERLLVDEKGFARSEIEVDADIDVRIGDEIYRSCVDLVVALDGIRFMAVKCAAGSLGSREREILAAARLLTNYQIPVSVVSDGKNAIVLDTATGRKRGEGLGAVPSRSEASNYLKEQKLLPLPPERTARERLIFRSYDLMNVNVRRKLKKNSGA